MHAAPTAALADAVVESIRHKTMNKRQNIGKVRLSVKTRRAVWNIVSAIFFRLFVTKLFRLWRIALLKSFGADIDWSADVYASAKVWAPWNLTMERGSCIGPDAIVYNQAMVTLGENACVSQYAYICTAGHAASPQDMAQTDSTTARIPLNNASTGLIVAPVTLGKDAWVGTRAFIGMGVEVGDHAVVGACACVFKDVEPHMVVGGNPARPL